MLTDSVPQDVVGAVGESRSKLNQILGQPVPHFSVIVKQAYLLAVQPRRSGCRC